MAARVWDDTQTARAGSRELGRLHIVAAGHGGGEEAPLATEEGKKRLARVAGDRAWCPVAVPGGAFASMW
jgi:hypothetical protein